MSTRRTRAGPPGRPPAPEAFALGANTRGRGSYTGIGWCVTGSMRPFHLRAASSRSYPCCRPPALHAGTVSAADCNISRTPNASLCNSAQTAYGTGTLGSACKGFRNARWVHGCWRRPVPRRGRTAHRASRPGADALVAQHKSKI
jgi:hypothetical protein